MQSCFNKQTDWVENTIDSLSLPYAAWKYIYVMDQPLQNPPASTGSSSSTHALKIAVIDSGVDYNDSFLQNYVQLDANGNLSGRDIISGDPRPSDDNGHGTAVVKYLAQLMGDRPFTFIPIKAIGSHGETHSAAIYDGFAYAVSEKPDAILMAWSSVGQTTSAFKMGQELAVKSGIPVFTAPGKLNSDDSAFVTDGLGGAYLTLDSNSAAAVT